MLHKQNEKDLDACNKKLKEIIELYPSEYEKIMIEICNKKIEELYRIKFEQEISNTIDNILNKIFKLCPKLKKNKQEILNSIKNKPEEDTKNPTQFSNKKEIVVEGIKYNNKIYYIDQYNGLTDEKFNLVGIYSEDNTIMLFDEIKNIDNDDDDDIYEQKKFEI